MNVDIMSRFSQGGPFMYVILAVGLFALFLLIERTWALYLRTRGVSERFREGLRTLLRKGDLDGARAFAQSNYHAALSPIVDLACRLRKDGVADDELQSRLDEALTDQIGRLDQRTGFLAVVGNIATLIGLLGTISGMITSFSAVSGATASERAAMLSVGISEAMNCTAFGLLVAIPALLGYALFQNRTERLVGVVTGSVAKLYHDLIYLSEPTTERGAR